MAATELATAYLSLVPSMGGAKGKIAAELSGVNLSGVGSDMGKSMGGGMLGSLKGMVGPALAVLGSGMFAGFIGEAAAASDATDKFKATMSFAGLDTSAITAAKDAAKGYADQTVYDLPTIQNMIAQLASNGVEDYTGLTKAAGNLNAVAGGNAETFKSVAMVMTQTAGAGKLTTENWNQMADAIPGAAGPLMKSLKEAGAYTGNFRDAMAAGEISSDEFNASLMKLGNDPVAVEAAKSTATFEGAIGSLQATINSGLMGALDAMKPAITGAINGVATGLGIVFDKVGGAVSGLKSLIVDGDFTTALRETFGVEEDNPAVGWVLDTRAALAEGIPGILDVLLNGNFSGALTSAFGLEEDSPVVGYLFDIREQVIAGLQGIKNFVAGFTIPLDSLLGAGVDLSGMVGIGVQVRGFFDGLLAAVAPLVPHLFELYSALSPVQLVFQALAPFLPQLLGMFLGLAGAVGGGLLSAVTGLVPSIMSLQSVFVGLLQGVLAQAIPVVLQLVTMLGQTFTQLVPILVPIITTLVALAATLIGQLAPIFMQLVTAVLPMVVSILGSVFAAIGPVIQIVAGLLIPIIQALMPVIVTVFGVVVSIITAAMQIVMGIIQVVTGIISGNWSQVWDGIVNIFSGVWNFIVAAVTGALAIVGSVIVAGLTLASQFIGGILGGIGQFFIDTWNNITKGISDFVGGIGDFFSGIPDAVKNALVGAGTWLYNSGKDIVNGLFEGIKSLAGTIGNFFLGLLPEWIVGPFKAALGIASPSKVFRGYGVNIGEGLVLGINDMADPVAEATAALAWVPDVPSFATSGAVRSYQGAAGVPDTGRSGPLVHQDIHPAEKMSEENLANIAARKIIGALV